MSGAVICGRGVSVTPARPERVQRRRTAGWRTPDGAIYIGRPTRWGNPIDFRAGEYCWLALSYGCRADAAGRREASVKAYREWVSAPPGLVTAEYERGFSFGTSERMVAHRPRIKVGRAPSLDEIRTLRGKTLACFCPLGAPCHADVLLEIANEDG